MYQFINPYNFVPLGSKSPYRVRKEAFYQGTDTQKALLSGWLDVEMVVKTPLIVPDGAHPRYFNLETGQFVKCKEDVKKKKDLHLEYDFLKLYRPESGKKEYAVPGSELRGLIRSIYESVTNSCFPFLLADKPMSQRVPLYGALRKRGLLGYDGTKWVLYKTVFSQEAVQINKIEKESKNNSNKTEFDYVFISKETNKKMKDAPGTYVEEKGWIQYNVPVVLKEKENGKPYHIAYLQPKKDENGNYEIVYAWPVSSAKGDSKAEKNNPLKAEAYKKLKSALVRDGVSGNKDHPNVKCNQALQNALEAACTDKNKLVPVYYLDVESEGEQGKETIVYLSGSAAGRIAQRRKWEDIVHEYKPCEKELCPACLLFGTIYGGLRGHIRVSDAFLEKPVDGVLTKNTLQILASPRTTAFEFYLDKPEEKATYWNFDFYGVTETDEKGNTHTNYYHLKQATLRGRKMYWHHELAKNAPKSNMNNTMECLENGKFQFKVYFDQITKKQLETLIFAITLEDNQEDSKLWHKLGHARPLGYGSVKLLVKDGTIRQFCENESGFRFCKKSLTEAGIDMNHLNPEIDRESENVQSLLRMCTSDATAGETVDYPRTRPKGMIYEWFAQNRTNAAKLKILPKAVGKVLWLKYTDDNDALNRDEVVTATLERYAEKKEDGYRFGIFVKLPGGASGLMHKKNAMKRLEAYEDEIHSQKAIKVKITDITVEKGRKKYSVSDKI